MDEAQMTVTADTTRLRGALATHADEVAEALSAAGVVHAHLFGSVARGDASADSDIDIYVVFSDTTPGRILMTTGGLTERLRRITNVRVDVVDETLGDPRVLETARKDLIPLESILT
ncbi:nucleotidyltransferase family protein [Gordonia rhizosphera]|uniref:nucleotidyltransferase family protein n=1 Tax=Gordonia rhizosphera TaxID=83341 RepID=UPI00031B4E1D|nr:nucleotidyltransferase domain-containing protein [Gordonia rhizosphera]